MALSKTGRLEGEGSRSRCSAAVERAHACGASFCHPPRACPSVQADLAAPQDFIAQGDGGEYILTPLRGSLTQLADSGYDALETLRWLYTHEDSLDATPIAALRSGRVATVRRAAQSLAF